MSLDLNHPGTFTDFEKLTQWAWENFKRLEEEFNFGREAFYLKTLYEEPRKPREGMIVLASGLTAVGPEEGWDPTGAGSNIGDGAGFYGYYGGTWAKLG